MFLLQEKPIDIESFKTASAGPDVGALVSFEGIVRADRHAGGAVTALLYHADVDACTAEGTKIIEETLSLFPVTKAICVQRIGRLNVGETAIWIGVFSGHRDEAFKACRYIIEEVKKRLLIWKKEFYTDGSGHWIQGTTETIHI